MNTIFGDKTSLVVAILTLVLLLLQVTFGILMKKHKDAFIKYHRPLGVVIFLVILANMIIFPQNLIISAIVLAAVFAQIIIGYYLSKGNKKLLKYHRPLGFFILILVIANLILIFPNK
jgi:hypothetical protein